MKKIMNLPEDYVDECLDGLCMANPSLKRADSHDRVIVQSMPTSENRVGIVSGGGSGHLPLFTGYVGEGLLDACSIGNVFEGPNTASCTAAIEVASMGAGVLCIYGNYGGDRMNFDMASEMVALDDIETKTVLGTDDIASAPENESDKRRGVAGILYAYKVAGAASAAGYTLDEVSKVTQRTVDQTRTIGIALTTCQVPGSPEPVSELDEDEIGFGMGIHGEPGIWKNKLKSANILVEEMVERLLSEKAAKTSKRVAVLVNSLGATPLEELFIIYQKLEKLLKSEGYSIEHTLVGPYVTSMEMAGASISLCFLDDEILEMLKKPASCPFWKID